MPGEPGLLLATEISRQNVSKEGWTTYYVSKDGNDGGNGLKWESAFLTIQRAIDVAESWAKIYVKTGTYNERVAIIAKNNIHLIGEDKATTIISPIPYGFPIDIRSDSCITQGFTLRTNTALTPSIRVVGDYNEVFDCILDATDPVAGGVSGDGDYNIIHDIISVSTNIGAVFGFSGNYWEIFSCLVDGTNFAIQFDGDYHKIHDNDFRNANNIGIWLLGATNNCSIYHNNLIGNTTQAQDDGANNEWWENFYDTWTTDTNNDGLTDTPYVFAGGTDYTPVSKRNGWLQESLGFSAGGITPILSLIEVTAIEDESVYNDPTTAEVIANQEYPILEVVQSGGAVTIYKYVWAAPCGGGLNPTETRCRVEVTHFSGDVFELSKLFININKAATGLWTKMAAVDKAFIYAKYYDTTAGAFVLVPDIVRRDKAVDTLITAPPIQTDLGEAIVFDGAKLQLASRFIIYFYNDANITSEVRIPFTFGVRRAR